MTLELTSVSFSYTSTPFIESIDVSANPGGILGIAGPNGSGKTTLLRLAAGLLTPATGKIHLDGVDLASMRRDEIAKSIAYIPSETVSTFDYTVREIVEMGRYAHKAPFESMTGRDARIVDDAMSNTGLSDLAGRHFMSLSSGERQRAVLARALAQEAKWFLLDEPTAHLDVRHQVDFLKLLRALARENGIGVIIATHDLSIPSRYCDRLILMKEGRIVKQGATEAVLLGPELSDIFQTEFEMINLDGMRIPIPGR